MVNLNCLTPALILLDEVLADPEPGPVAPVLPLDPAVPVAPVKPVAPNPLITLIVPVSSTSRPSPTITPPTVLEVATGNT